MSFISVDKLSREFDAPGPALRDYTPPPGFARLKRGFDIVLALVLLGPVGLVCLIVAALNPFLNPGPLFFNQVRMGRGGRPFVMYKLRTMTGAPESNGLLADDSHRITRFGAFLRSKRLDELPQVLNVLLGQMSFVGPRPEQHDHYAEILRHLPGYKARLVVRPGISGLAQVESGYARELGEVRTKLRYDLHYIRNMGLAMELYVIGQTFKVLVTGFGAR